MKIRLLVLLFCALSSLCAAQTSTFPAGIYMSVDELLSRTPSVQLDVTLSQLKTNEGNDYKLEAEGKEPAFFKKEAFAYSDGQTLYLNALKFQASGTYTTLTKEGGRFLYFSAGMSLDKKTYKRQYKAAANPSMGVAFGAIGGAIEGARLAKLRYQYVYDKQAGKIFALDLIGMQELLAQNPELLEKFKSEAKPKEQETQIKYLEILDAEVAPEP